MPIPTETVVSLLLLLALISLVCLHQIRAAIGSPPYRRPLAALDLLRNALRRGAETGRPTHISPGSGMPGGVAGSGAVSAELLAGILLAERAATEACRNSAPLLVSSGDAVAHLALRGGVRQAYHAQGQPQAYHPQQVQLLAHHDGLAYATALSTLYAREQLEASTLVGSFQQELLLPGEEAAQRDLPQIAGSTNAQALPLMILSTPTTLIGEEIYAAEAYLAPPGPAQARLLTQDLLRTLVILLLILGLLYQLLQPIFALPPLPDLQSV